MKKIIHVNQHNIKYNNKNKNKKPVLTCKTYKSNEYGNTIIIKDKNGKELAKIVYQPNKPLSCGAKAWIETKEQVEII